MGWNNSTKKMTAPLTIGDISTATGAASGDLGTCITTGTINKWAKYKPQRSSDLGELSSRGNYGFDFSDGDGDTTVYFSSIVNALRAALNPNRCAETGTRRIHLGPGDWPYLRPRGNAQNREEWFRMFDFLNDSNHSTGGYYSEAPYPYKYTIPASPTECHTETCQCEFAIRKNSGAELYLTDFTKQNVNIGNLYLGIVYRKSTESSSIAHLVRSSATVSSLTTSTDSTITVTFPSQGTYYGCFVATSASPSGDGTGSTIYFPDTLLTGAQYSQNHSTFEFSYSISGVPVDYDISWVSSTPSISSYDQLTDSYTLSLPTEMQAEFWDHGSSPHGNPQTNGQFLDLQISLFVYNSNTQSNELIWDYVIQGVGTLPSSTGQTTLSSYTSTITIPWDDVKLYAGSTVKVVAQLNSRGTGQGNAFASLYYAGTGDRGLETTTTLPTKTS